MGFFSRTKRRLQTRLSSKRITASQNEDAGNDNPSGPRSPWSAQHLTSTSQLPSSHSPFPFPRYGHTVSSEYAGTGVVYLFGGLIYGETLCNDMYIISLVDNSVRPLQTKGEIPTPRVGHASVLVKDRLVVWGGDTNTDMSTVHEHDDGLYLLDLDINNWTHIPARELGPCGRYGHTMNVIGSQLLLFGGQTGTTFFNDVWILDLQSIGTDPAWNLTKQGEGATGWPACRTGHVSIAFEEKLYVFGGTDGMYHYNDTWSFDPKTREWTELKCVGCIPSPREGHAASIINDVVYVFGGRGVDGKDLDSLVAFRISDHQWFAFQDMNHQAPSGRSGHVMVAIGARAFVFGGEAFMTAHADEMTLVHVLDTDVEL